MLIPLFCCLFFALSLLQAACLGHGRNFVEDTSTTQPLPLCDFDDASRALSGAWTVDSTVVSDELSPEHVCAATAASNPERICSAPAGEKGEPYRCAQFMPSECHTPRLERSLHQLAALCGSKQLLFVGDSLNRQNHVAVQCVAENMDVSSVGLKGYSSNEYLVDNRPCHVNCTNEAFFKHEAHALQIGTRHGTCSRCNEDFHPPILAKPAWMASLEADLEAETSSTCALILGTGAWYSTLKGVPCPEAVYQDTLTLLKPLLRNVSSRGVPVIWLGLPPCTHDCELENGRAWGNFAQYDALAAASLNGIATFINVSKGTRERKALDPTVSMDGLHWCGPGPCSVPQFIMQIALHELVLQLKMNGTPVEMPA